jgi:phage repressor protein C with HTH and peptisase S24 domain
VQQEISQSRPSAGSSYAPFMDAVRELILREAKKPGRSLKRLSLDIGRNETYLQQFIRKGSPERLDEVDRRKLAGILAVDEIELGAPAGELQAAARPAQNARVAGNVQLGAVIPAYGHAVGGSDGEFILNGNKIADLLAPPSLAGVRDAYAVYVVGDSMEERYQAGEAVFVNPRLPVRRGDYVVAQIASHEGEAPYAFVKRFVGQDAKHLKLEQLNPPKRLEFPRSRVVSVHRIVMGGDG